MEMVFVHMMANAPVLLVSREPIALLGLLTYNMVITKLLNQLGLNGIIINSKNNSLMITTLNSH